jgi:NAD(P)-dependent dehydrogenase (short-subunit alcohol dehydrogenase family)
MIVTGASSGIGRVTAERLADEGAAVVLAARRKDLGESVADAIRSRGGEALFTAVDVTEEAAVARMVETTVSTYGRLDGVFNNAGVQEIVGPVQTIGEATWRRIVDVSLTGTFLCLKHQIPALLESGGGSGGGPDGGSGGAIVNNASTLGVVGAPALAPYVAAKHGVVGLTRSAALELADRGVRVNALITGTTDTSMADQFRERFATRPEIIGPTGRLARAEEVASLATYLLSAEASYITGAALTVDGGATAR